MYIGILVHSETGHTLSVAQRIEKKLTEKGHSCRIEQISAVGETPQSSGQVPSPIRFDAPPDAASYDAVILGAPVWGFSLSKVMAAYMAQSSGLSGKKVGCFVTQQLPSPFFGGNHAIRQMKSACQAKGASVYASGGVNWSNPRREGQIDSLVESFAGIG